MKNVKLMFTKIFSILCVVCMVVVMAGCQTTTPDNKCPGCGKEGVVHAKCTECGGYVCVGDHNHTQVTGTITMKSSKTEIYKGETASMDIVVDVKGTDDKSYTLTTNKENLVEISDNKITLTSDMVFDDYITITATLNANSSITASTTIRLKAPLHIGQVGELTSDMLKEIGNENITIKGKVTDIYQDFNQSANNSTNVYDMLVKMDKDAWYGEWNIENDEEHKIVNNYRKGTVDGLKDQYGNIGHALEQLYIDKNNQVVRKAVTDYISLPSIWEAQHLWNHISNLNIERFELDEKNNAYKYTLDVNSEADLYLMTYLSISLTPMLEDTLSYIYLVVEDGHITQLLAQTEILYYGSESGTSEDADAMSYTQLSISFSEIGTTVVEEPTPYEAPQYAEKLEAALNQMKELKNYTFRVVDTMTSMPSTDGDYELLSVTGSTSVLSNKALKVQNNTSSVGTTGRLGKVTEEAVLFADTIEYTATMDGKPYRTEYTGYKQNTDGTFDEFEYSATTNSLVGKKRVKGNIFDKFPSFDFSANVFEFAGSSLTATGKATYTFVLKDSNLTRDIALEVCDYKYADDADASVSMSLRITVDEEGNLVSTTFPYNIYDAYIGYCTTTYYDFNTTVLDEDLFDGYVPREVKTSWNQYTTKYFSPTFSSLDSHEENTEVVLRFIFGDAMVDVPSPEVFMEICGDGIMGPFFNSRVVGVDADGNNIEHGYLSIKTQSDEYDENRQILNFFELMAEYDRVLTEQGFVLSVANTDTTGGASGHSDRYVCYIKNDVQIVFSNNYTSFIDINFYKTGDWTLKR